MHTVYLSLGTNLGNKEENITEALQQIKKLIGSIVSQSAFYVTQPWGFNSENEFLNMAVAISSSFTPQQILEATQNIERSMGRTEKSIDHRYKDRLIDIDILLYDNLVYVDDKLTLPHPLMTERLFVMQPLCEIAPNLIHPTLKQSIKDLLISLEH